VLAKIKNPTRAIENQVKRGELEIFSKDAI
jgi:hypothetical protein